jgi:hypothetical protein
MLARDPRTVEAEARKRAMQGRIGMANPMPKIQPKPAPLPSTGPIAAPKPGAGAAPGTQTDGPVRLPGAGGTVTPKPGAIGGGGGAPTPVPGVATPAEQPKTQEDIDQMIRDRVARELGAGPQSTAEDEALIQQRMGEAIGSGAVNARARAGRGGFQASGALMGVEGDLERQARTAAAEQALGLRRDAREDQFAREGDVIKSELDMRRAAADDEINRRLLELLGMDGQDAGGAAADPVLGRGGIIDPILSAVGAERDAPEMPNAGRQSGSGSVSDPIVVSAPPPGAQRRGTDAQGREMWFTVDDKGVYTHYRIGG